MQRLRDAITFVSRSVQTGVLGLLLLWSVPAFAQTAPAAVQATAVADAQALAREEWKAVWYWDYAASLGPPVDADAFVTTATAVRGWSVSLVPTATLDNYGFQLKFAANLFDMLRQPLMTGNGARFLRRSSVELPFDVLSVVQKSEDRGNGTSDNVLKGTFPRSAAFTYKYTLIGDDIEDREEDLTTAILEATNRVFPKYRNRANPSLLDETRLEEIAADLKNAVDIEQVQRQLKRQLRIAAKTSYAAKWTDGTRNEFTLGLSGTKLLRDAKRLPITANADINWIHALEETDVIGYTSVRSGGTVDVDFSNALKFSFGVNMQHYYGDGFSGIRGVLDPTKTTEWNLSQALGFRTAQGHYVGFAIRESHFGTGDRDVSLATEFGFRF